ncbi:MAG: hypothetical protein WC223_01475 [Bacteroidales bacterium]|jgi:hypothetical protein
MTKNNIEDKPYSLAFAQLNLFEEELKEAGSFDELMILKEALERRDWKTSIITYENINEYKEKHLIGKYKLLHPFFNTKVPYAFWAQLYTAVKERKELLKLI